jgi:hypothetical protein
LHWGSISQIPKGWQYRQKLDKNWHKNPKTVPFHNKTVPFHNKTVPFHNKTVPFHNKTVPFHNKTVPFHNKHKPDEHLHSKKVHMPKATCFPLASFLFYFYQLHGIYIIIQATKMWVDYHRKWGILDTFACAISIWLVGGFLRQWNWPPINIKIWNITHRSVVNSWN